MIVTVPPWIRAFGGSSGGLDDRVPSEHALGKPSFAAILRRSPTDHQSSGDHVSKLVLEFKGANKRQIRELLGVVAGYLRLKCINDAMGLMLVAGRVHMGVHYPTDVMAGWTAGLAWVARSAGWSLRALQQRETWSGRGRLRHRVLRRSFLNAINVAVRISPTFMNLAPSAPDENTAPRWSAGDPQGGRRR